jgi:rubrerythrin
MSEPHEPIPDEADDEPVDEPGPSDDDTIEDEAHEAEEAAQEPAEASQPKSEKEIEKALKAVERAGTSYRNAISRAMGEDAQALIQCPRCNAPVAGMVFPVEVAPVDDETREAVLASIGEGVAAGPPLQDAKGVETCPTCLGHGQLKYPTLNPHVQTQQCPKCAGQGYITAGSGQENVYSFTPTPPVENATSGTEFASVPSDAWARPFGHPHYGIAPANVGT